MKSKIKFHSKGNDFFKGELEKKEKKILNFLNLYSIYLFQKNPLFREAILKQEKNTLNTADGFVVSKYLRTKKIRGTDFTINVLKHIKDRKHFFLGADGASEEGVKKIVRKFSLNPKKTFYYNPPYIKSLRFPKEEVEKIIKIINSKKPDYLWIGLGNPKQEIMAHDLFDRIKVKKIFNVGGAIDFLTGSKKQAPHFWKLIGFEWIYRFLTDFKYSRKKVFRSFIGLFYLPVSVTK